MLEDHFQIPFEDKKKKKRPVCHSSDRNTASPVNFKAYWDGYRCKAFCSDLVRGQGEVSGNARWQAEIAASVLCDSKDGSSKAPADPRETTPLSCRLQIEIKSRYGLWLEWRRVCPGLLI